MFDVDGVASSKALQQEGGTVGGACVSLAARGCRTRG